jgi:hypothetical protein
MTSGGGGAFTASFMAIVLLKDFVAALNDARPGGASSAFSVDGVVGRADMAFTPLSDSP